MRTVLIAAAVILQCPVLFAGQPPAYINEANSADLARFDSLRTAVFDAGPASAAIMKQALMVIKGMPQKGPKDAARNVLLFMNATLKYRPDFPVGRAPEAWSAEQSLAYGSTNGCVEAAKVFYALYRGAYPDYYAVPIGSFNSQADEGGHAVVELRDGREIFIVNASAYNGLPRGIRGWAGAAELAESDLETPVSFRPDKRGVIVQVKDDCDMFAGKRDGEYFLERYPYGRIFDAAPLAELKFPSLGALNSYLQNYGRPEYTFDDLVAGGQILRYTDASRSAFVWRAPGGQVKYVVFSCAEGDVPGLEARARAEYKSAGKVSTCVR
mgnify:CR=1 FL=1